MRSPAMIVSIAVLGLRALLGLAGTSAAVAAARPNFVVILVHDWVWTDDQAAWALGAGGHPERADAAYGPPGPGGGPADPLRRGDAGLRRLAGGTAHRPVPDRGPRHRLLQP